MRRKFYRLTLLITIPVAFCAPAFADDTYAIHENLHVGQKVKYAVGSDIKIKSAPTPAGVSSVSDVETGQYWHVTLTVQAVKDGSSAKSKADVDADSYDTVQTPGRDEVKIPCPFAGKSIVLTANPNGTGSNDFKGQASDSDAGLLNGLISPDQDAFPDKPVAVGDTWDNSTIVAKHAGLDANDKVSSKCHLDWVKTIDGKQMAQITNTYTYVYKMDDKTEEDGSWTGTMLVDVAAGMIVKFDEQGSSQYKNTAGAAPVVTGGTEFAFHAEVTDNTPPATQP